MVHPICAHARPPHDSPARNDSPDEPRPDPLELTMQAIREIKAARAAYHVVARVQSIDDATEARELMLLADAEFKHRVELAMKALRSMRSPGSMRHKATPAVTPASRSLTGSPTSNQAYP